MAETVVYCDNLEQVKRELEVMLRDKCRVTIEEVANPWGSYDGRIKMTASENRQLRHGKVRVG